MNQMNVWGMTDIGLVRKENQDAYATAQHEASGRTVGVVCPARSPSPSIWRSWRSS